MSDTNEWGENISLLLQSITELFQGLQALQQLVQLIERDGLGSKKKLPQSTEKVDFLIFFLS
jgi:hypothetical protein